MRVLYTSDILTIHDFRFLKKLSLKYEVCLVTFKESKIPFNIKQIKDLTIIHFPTKCFLFKPQDNLFIKIVRSFANGINFAKKYFCLKSVIKKIKPDIIHGGWVQSSGFLAALTGFHPFVLMPWGCDILRHPFLRKRQMWLAKYAISKADRIICDSNEVKNKIMEISKYDEKKIVVFRWGVDSECFASGKLDEKILKDRGWSGKKIVISTRSFEKIYGLNYLIEAVPEIIEKLPEARFIFCGDGIDKEEIFDLVKKLKVEDYIYFAGFVDEKRLPFYLNSADIYVSSSLSDGTSISLLEAFACGKSVVVTDVPANLEWVKNGEGGYIVPRRSSKILAEKIIALLKNDDLRNKMGRKNSEIVKERGDWDKNFEIIESAYKELTNV